MHYATAYLRARKLSLDGVELKVSASKGGQPMRLMDMEIEVDAPGLTARAREGLIKSIEACLLHQTLANPARVKISMATVVTEGPPAAQPFNLAP
jgi:hypothetical protein